MQKHVNFEPRSCVRSPSLTRHCLPGAARHGAAGTLPEPAPCRPRSIVSHVRQPRFATPPQYSQVVHTYPSLVDAVKMKTPQIDKYRQLEEPERLPPEPCACRRCASRTLSPARQFNASPRQSNANLRRSNVSLRRFRDNIAQFSDRGTMTAVTNDAVCEAQGPKRPPHRVVDVQRSEIPSVWRSPSTSSRDNSSSILKRPSGVTGLNFIMSQEQPELDQAESFPQARQDYFEDDCLNGYWGAEDIMYPIEKVPELACVGPGREWPCEACAPPLPRGDIPHSHRPGGRYHQHCGQPCVEESCFYKTTTLGEPRPPWCPVTQGPVVFKPLQDRRRPRRVLSSDRNIDLFMDKEDLEFMLRRNRYH